MNGTAHPNLCAFTAPGHDTGFLEQEGHVVRFLTSLVFISLDAVCG